MGIDILDDRVQIETDDPALRLENGVANFIYDYNRNIASDNLFGVGKGVISPEAEHYLPIWQVRYRFRELCLVDRSSEPLFIHRSQTSPVTRRAMVNQNRESNSDAVHVCIATQEVVIEGMDRSSPGYGDDAIPRTAEMAWLMSMRHRRKTKYLGDIFTSVYYPVFDNFSDDRKAVAVMRFVIHWEDYFEDILPESKQGIVLVLENSCDLPFTYKINGGKVVHIGTGDHHETKFDKYKRSATFQGVTEIADGTSDGMKLHQGDCPYTISVYPSSDFAQDFKSPTPLLLTFTVCAVFIFTIFIFFCYDFLVERRQRLLMRKATQTHQIVASLFPKNIHERLLNETDGTKSTGLLPANHRLKNFLNGDDNHGSSAGQTPIADLFPQCTVLFADISGFTAWSSSREPAQVFILLQTVYQAFDRIAKQRKVFKVETIGDSVSATISKYGWHSHALQYF